MGLYDYGQAVLANVEALWAGVGVDLPVMRYVAEGPFETIAAELCEQVVVSFDGLTVGAPGEPRSTYARLPGEWSSAVTISIWRECMATSQDTRPPLVADHNTAAQITLRDLDLLWRNAKTLYAALGCKHHSIVNATLLNVEGAAGGSKITAYVDLLLGV